MALTDYDRQNLSSSQQAAVEKATADWNAANARGDTAGMAAAHAAAEAARNSAGYSSDASGNYSGSYSSRGSSSGSSSRSSGSSSGGSSSGSSGYSGGSSSGGSGSSGGSSSGSSSSGGLSAKAQQMVNNSGLGQMSSMTNTELRNWANSNSKAWWSADADTQAALHEVNNQINAELDRRAGTSTSYDSASGTWKTSGYDDGNATADSVRAYAERNYTPTGTNFDKQLSAQDKAAVQAYSDAWYQAAADYQNAKYRGDTQAMADAEARMHQAHADAEAIRANYNYSGGADGSEYITWSQQTQVPPGYSMAGYSSGVPTIAGLTNRAPDLQGLLAQWLQEAKREQELKVDYAVEKGVLDLQRAEEDAKEQFQTQRNQIDAAAAKASDNQALYNERRGDRGGIGAAQYDTIQNTAAQNQLAVNQAQTKLSTDTARQIADLRAQGEFQKADALLQLSQTYLSKLIDIEQWAAEFNLSVDQFNKQIEQWNNEFELKVADLLGSYRGQQTLASKSLDLQAQNQAFNQQMATRSQDFDEAYKSASLTGIYQGSQTLQARSALAEAGIALAQAGIMPSASQMEAMQSLYGYDESAVSGLVQTAKLAQQAGYSTYRNSGSSGGRNNGGNGTTKDTGVPDIKTQTSQWLAYYGYDNYDDAYDALVMQGIDEDVADRRAKAYVQAITPQAADYETYKGIYRTLLETKRQKGVAAAQARFYNLCADVELSDSQLKDLKKLVGLN